MCFHTFLIRTQCSRMHSHVVCSVKRCSCCWPFLHFLRSDQGPVPADDDYCRKRELPLRDAVHSSTQINACTYARTSQPQEDESKHTRANTTKKQSSARAHTRVITNTHISCKGKERACQGCVAQLQMILLASQGFAFCLWPQSEVRHRELRLATNQKQTHRKMMLDLSKIQILRDSGQLSQVAPDSSAPSLTVRVCTQSRQVV